MKVKLTSDMKKHITLEEAPLVQAMIKEFKEDETPIPEYAEMAIRAAWDTYSIKVIEATAEIAKNCRVHNFYSENSGTLDIWIEATAQTIDGFIIIGACLSDIWQINGENNAELISHMYIKKFKEAT